MKITNSVYFYQGLQSGIHSWSNSIVINGKKRILIDPGSNMKYHLKDLVGAMNEDGIDISKIDEIWLTHAHPDHAGSAGTLVKQFNIKKLRCHFKAGGFLSSSAVTKKFLIYFTKEVVRGKKIVRTPFFWRKALLKILISLPRRIFDVVLWFLVFGMEKIWGKWLPVFNLEVFDKEEIIENQPDIQILFLPGHAPEEIGFWLKDEKVLIIGDLINTGYNREIIPALVTPQSNFGDALFSIKKMSNLPVEILIPAHGFFLRNKEMIGRIFEKIISRMEKHQKMVKEEVEKNPRLKYELDELSKTVLYDLPLIISHSEKKQYLVAICDNLGYYNNKNNKNNKKL